MRRNSLLAAGVLAALLATSACSDVTGAPAPLSSDSSAGVEAGSNTWQGSPAAEVGVSQKAAAERAAARKAEAAAAEKAEKAAADEKAKKAEAAAAAEKGKPTPGATASDAAALARTADRVPAAGLAPSAMPSAPKQSPAATPAASSEQIVTTTYTTAYTWYDNTPAGSAAISHPVLHKTAGGTGTYEDPITIAVGHSLATGEDVLDFPAGTRIYLPDVRRYFIVEDTCGDGRDPENGPCHQGANAHGTNSTIWIDMWIGGQSASADAANACARKVTNVKTAVFNPASNYVVAPGAGVIHDGTCDAGYGNTLVKQ